MVYLTFIALHNPTVVFNKSTGKWHTLPYGLSVEI